MGLHQIDKGIETQSDTAAEVDRWRVAVIGPCCAQVVEPIRGSGVGVGRGTRDNLHGRQVTAGKSDFPEDGTGARRLIGRRPRSR